MPSSSFWDLEPLAAQRHLSARVVALVGEPLRRAYQREMLGTDIGSYARGTAVDDVIDIDALFQGLPIDATLGYHDWTDYDTYGSNTADELSTIEQIRGLDPVLAEAISGALDQVSTIADVPVFRWLRTGRGTADVYFRVEGVVPEVGPLAIDVTLAQGHETFGLEHARRFEHYLERLARELGQSRALDLLADIRQFKCLAKAHAAPEGIVDKRAKVPGFLIESLFCSGREPRTLAAVVQELVHDVQASELHGVTARPEYIVNQDRQLVDTGVSVSDVARYVTHGGYRTLTEVAELCS